MKKKAIAILLLQLWAGAAAAQNRDPAAARIVSEDIERFWAAYDSAGGDVSAEVLERHYLRQATPGLQAFAQARIGSAGAMAAAIRANSAYYRAARASTLRAHSLEPQIRAALHRFAELLPVAIFPDIYLLIGRMSAAGTTAPAGLLLGTELFGLTAETPLAELNQWERSIVRPVEDLPTIIIHELVHVQQREPPEPYTLLVLATAEGVADLIAELVTGRHGNEALHSWAAPREAELWREFAAAMHGENVEDWLYNGAGSAGRPADLGYFVGYRIARAYYDAAPDKKAAVRDMLAIDDFPAFLRASGYASGFPY